MIYDVIIIGAGLGGSALATHLARAGFQVLLLEAKAVPRHKLCGEFLSVEVARLFKDLGVLDDVKAVGAHAITRTKVTAMGGQAFEVPLPGTALGLSRYRLDALLVDAARAAGAQVRMGLPATTIAGDLAHGFEVQTREAIFSGHVVVGAYGRRSAMDRQLARPFLKETTPWVAFKAHYSGVSLPHLIELHAFPGGYCSVSHVEEGLTNACWIGHVDYLKAADGDPERLIDQTLRLNAHLDARFSKMERQFEGFLSVGQVSFAIKGTFERDVGMVGDAAGMIAPMFGDGMAMALQSAALAAREIAGFLSKTGDASAFRASYDASWRRAFATRMRLGRMLHPLFCKPRWAESGVGACARVPSLANWLIRQTRSAA